MVNNSLTLDLSKIPLDMEELHQKNWMMLSIEGNIDRISYLQLFCAGRELTKELEEKVFEVIELFIKAGADIHYKDKQGSTIIEHIQEHKILAKILDISGVYFSKEQLLNQLKKFEAKLEYMKKVYIYNQLSTDRFPNIKSLLCWWGVSKEPQAESKVGKLLYPALNYLLYNCSEGELKTYINQTEDILIPKVTALYKYIFERYEKKWVVQGFISLLPLLQLNDSQEKGEEINLSKTELLEMQLSNDVEQAFLNYFNNKDILNLKQTCKAINNVSMESRALSYEARIEQARQSMQVDKDKDKDKTSTCIMM